MKKLALISSFLTIGILLGGCQASPQDKKNASVHLKQYLQMKQQQPDAALVELKAHANIAFKSHPKANEWAVLAFRLDRSGKAPLPDMRRLNNIVLEMARDNQMDTAYIHKWEDNVHLLNELEKELKSEGTDPNTFYINFTLSPREKK